jgi:hypothetical protein
MYLTLKYDSSYMLYTVRTGLLTFAQIRLPVSSLAASILRRLAGREIFLAASQK